MEWKLVGSQSSSMSYSAAVDSVNGIDVDLLVLHVQLEMDHKYNGETLINKGRTWRLGK